MGELKHGWTISNIRIDRNSNIGECKVEIFISCVLLVDLEILLEEKAFTSSLGDTKKTKF